MKKLFLKLFLIIGKFDVHTTKWKPITFCPDCFILLNEYARSDNNGICYNCGSVRTIRDWTKTIPIQYEIHYLGIWLFMLKVNKVNARTDSNENTALLQKVIKVNDLLNPNKF